VLLQTRRWILEAYFHVDAATRLSEAATMIENHNYDLVLFCYSITPDECRIISELVRKRSPQTRILSLKMELDDCLEAYFDAQILVREGPYALLKKVAGMLGSGISNKITSKSERQIPMGKKLARPIVIAPFVLDIKAS
jgi:hypothetical protein